MNVQYPTQKLRQNLTLRGHRTSLALEVAVWDALTEICRREETSLDELCEMIVANIGDVSMASSIRSYTLEYFVALEEGATQPA
jgi:predicted DNA-binding ribbon-helix-helix protein